MTTQNGNAKASRKASIRELLQGRTQIAEKLAGQLDKYEAAKDAVAAAEQAAADEAAKAREVYQEAIDAGWTATELTSAGLKPPAPPRKRGSSSEAEPAAAAS
jgi:hypothetical protein